MELPSFLTNIAMCKESRLATFNDCLGSQGVSPSTHETYPGTTSPKKHIFEIS